LNTYAGWPLRTAARHPGRGPAVSWPGGSRDRRAHRPCYPLRQARPSAAGQAARDAAAVSHAGY